jgi:hypothetical protein
MEYNTRWGRLHDMVSWASQNACGDFPSSTNRTDLSAEEDQACESLQTRAEGGCDDYGAKDDQQARGTIVETTHTGTFSALFDNIVG